MKYLAAILILLAGCAAPGPTPQELSALKVHFITGGGVLVEGPVWRTIIREDGSVLVEIKNILDDK